MKAHELLDKPEKWTKGSYAKDATGKPLHWANDSAVCYCLSGAILKCYGPNSVINMEPFNKLYEKTQTRTHEWNDAPERTWEEVYGLLKELDI